MRNKLLILGLLCYMSLGVDAQGIDFYHGTWAEAVEKAKAEDKLIFVDGYAVWCGPCKALAKNVFPKANVGEFFNENFVNIKMDMEKGEGRTFRKTYPVSAFPTLYFIAPNGDVVHKTKGAPRTPEALIELGAVATQKYDRSVDFLKLYDEGDRSYEIMYNLVKALNKSNKSSLKYANEYLRTQDDLSTPENLKFIFEGLTQLDSRMFDEFIIHQSAMQEMYQEAEIENKIDKAAQKTTSNAIEFESIELLKEGQNKYAKLYPKKAKAFEAESNLSFAIATKDADLFLANMKAVDYDLKKQKQIINSSLKEFGDDTRIVKAAEKWAKSVAQKDGEAGSYYLLAMTQVKQNKSSQAIKSLEKCIEKTDSNSREFKLYQEQLLKLKSN